MKKQIRKRYFLEKGFQLRYANTILLITFLAAFIGAATTFFTTWSILGEKLSYVYPQGLFMDTFKNVLVALFRNMLILSVFVYGFAIIVSHRIAGPIYRLKAFIHDLGEGNLEAPIHLRRTDELRDVAEELNKAREKLIKIS